MIFLIHFLVINFIFLGVKKNKNTYIVIYIYSLLVYGLRWNVGTDYPGYVRLFLQNKFSDLGYYLLQFYILKNHLTFEFLIFVCFFISISNFIYFLYKYTKANKVALYLFVFSEMYFQQMSQIRQYVAIGFVIMGIFYLINKNRVRSLLFFLLGLLFHKSAIIVIILILVISKLKINKIFYKILMIFLFLEPFINFSFLVKYFGWAYSNYINSPFSTSLSFFNLMKYYSILFFLILYRYKKNGFVNVNPKIHNWILLYLFLYGISFKFGILIRLSFYLKIFEVVYLSYYISNNKIFERKLSYIIVMVVCLINYLGVALLDPYDINPFNWKYLKLKERNNYEEIENVYRIAIEGVEID